MVGSVNKHMQLSVVWSKVLVSIYCIIFHFLPATNPPAWPLQGSSSAGRPPSRPCCRKLCGSLHLLIQRSIKKNLRTSARLMGHMHLGARYITTRSAQQDRFGVSSFDDPKSLCPCSMAVMEALHGQREDNNLQKKVGSVSPSGVIWEERKD